MANVVRLAKLAEEAVGQCKEAVMRLEQMRQLHDEGCPGCGFADILDLATACIGLGAAVVEGHSRLVDEFMKLLDEGSFRKSLEAARKGMDSTQDILKASGKHNPGLN